MSDLRQTLNEVLAGSKPPTEFLKAVDAYLAQPDARIDALRSLIDAAEHLGLSPEIAAQARERIPDSGSVVDIGDPTAMADEKTELTTGRQPTRLRADPAEVDPDRTEISGDPERTMVTGSGADPERTMVTGAGDDPDRTEVTGSDDDRTVQASGDDPFAMEATAPTDEIGPGTVLKGRFRLEEVIGQGGMGAVYKAVDLLKVEARDRNPYIAVKLLVGDFKEHPEAFISLQRESAKAQRLAHPNIATVYDFDRDGETVYMTMELMVGAELAKYIKKLPAGGLPVPDAMKVIEQLCAGLQYAHARGLVHSDFKPGNAFLLEDGTVKLLDFGIARASKTKADAEGESTVFDPGQLGALTPAYATIEMFEGEDPDPRDDIYALAAVSYELFTGKHPFNKMSAVKAKEKNLKVAPIEKLTKRQNKTLMKALALHRADRTPSVEEFWEGIKVRKDYTLHIAAGATAAVVLIGLLTYGPIMGVIHEREHTAIVTEIDSGDESRLVAALEAIDALPMDRQRTVAERAREHIINYFQERAENAIDDAAGRYDYPTALAEVAAMAQYFPDSAQVAQIRQEIDQRRLSLTNTLRERFGVLLEDGRVLPDTDDEDITDVLAILREAQPESDLLSDPRLINAYVELATARGEAGDWEGAHDILEVGLRFAARDPALINLQDTVATNLRREQEAALVASLRDRLRDQRPQTLEGFREIREPLQQLGSMRPDDEPVRALTAPLQRVVDASLSDHSEAGRWQDADALLAEFAQVLPMDALVERRAALTRAQLAAGHQPGADAERVADVTRRIGELRQLIAEPEFDDDFERTLTAQFKELTARLTEDTDEWDALRAAIAETHIAHARRLMGDDRYAVAEAVIDQGRMFHSDLPAFADAREALADARAAFEAERERIAAERRIENLKQGLLGYAQSNNTASAVRELDELRGLLPEDDAFLVTEGPAAIAAAFERLIARAAEESEYVQARDFARAGLAALPDHPDLQQAQARFTPLANAASATAANFGATVRTPYNAFRQQLGGADAAAYQRLMVAQLEARMRRLEGANELAGANALHAAALELFPGNQQLTRMELRQPERPSEFAPRIRAAIESNQLTRARELLTQSAASERGHSELARFPDELSRLERAAEEEFAQARRTLPTNRNLAQQRLTRALEMWSDNADFEAFRAANFQVTTAPARADDGSVACAANLAGHGARGRRAACYDMVAGQRAPEMVVIPAPEGGEPFAFGKYEVTVGEYNHFCRSGGGCQQIAGDESYPVTGITIQQAEAYVAWLGEQTGKGYRLPSDTEWSYAAGGGGNPGRSGDFNCRVVQGGNVIKGHSLTRVTTGPSNGWGVANAVGNAQEWVRGGSSLLARGGSFQDPLSNCEVDLSRPHGGGADDATGFRVARDID